MSEILLSIFSSVIFMVSRLIFKCFIHFEFFLVHGVTTLSSYFLACISPISWTPFMEDYLYLIVCFCLLCQILIDHKDMGLFLGSLFSSIDLCVCFHAVPCCFPSYNLVIVWYQIVRFLQRCSFLKIVVVIWGPYKFLEYLFQFCEICPWYLDRNCIESVGRFQ